MSKTIIFSKDSIGTCTEEAVRSILANMGFSRVSQEEIIRSDYGTATSYASGIESKMTTAVEALKLQLADTCTEVTFPSIVTELVLHGQRDDPRISRIRAGVIAHGYSEDSKITIACSMIEAVHGQHQLANRYSFNGKNAYRPNVPRIDHAIRLPDPTDDLYFIPVWYCPWDIISEHYWVVRPVLKLFGLAPDDRALIKRYEKKQSKLPLKSKEALEDHIRHSADFDPYFRKGAKPLLLANHIRRANGLER